MKTGIPDNPHLVYMALFIVSEYGVAVAGTSDHAFGVSEKKLPHSKKEIQAVIEFLLKFLNNRGYWRSLIEKYPKVAKEVINANYYDTLRAGYVELSKFVPEDEAVLCEKLNALIDMTGSREKDTEKSLGHPADEIKPPWFDEANQIIKRIAQESSSRLQWLHSNFKDSSALFQKS